jgi:tRNA(Ile)-lysidine synthase
MSHKIHLLGNVPKKIGIAVSGGPDSMAALDFFIRGKKDVIAYHFNHGTEHGKDAEIFVRNYCQENKVNLVVGNIDNFREKEKRESPEEYWRNARYNFLDKYNETPMVMCQQLDDQVENWIFTSLRGNPKLIPYQRDHYIRPLLLTTKSTLIYWCERKGVPFITDPSNFSDDYSRSFIRCNIVPEALKVNPGLYTVIKKKVESEYKSLRFF